MVGGDCPILIGALAGCADAESGTPPALLFVDGHEDAWPPLASTTGEAADMELGLLLGRSIDDIDPTLRAQIPRLDPATVAVLGARDRAELDAAGVPSLDRTVTVVDDADDRGRIRLVWRARPSASVAAGRSGWWLHVDLDVLSSRGAPRGRLPPGRWPHVVAS